MCVTIGAIRSIAQLGRAQPSGGWGRRFESSCSDQNLKAKEYTFAFFVIQFPCKALGQPTAEK